MKFSGTSLRNVCSGAAINQIARRGQVAVLCAAVLLSSGCYTSAAVPLTQPLVAQRAEFRVNDSGRLQLAQQLGPGTLSVEGRVVRQDESGWTLRVYRHIDLRGQATTWSGEVIELPRTSVELVTRRDFDRVRTAVAMASVAGGLTLFVLSRSLLGGGPTPGEEGGGPPGASIRY